MRFRLWPVFNKRGNTLAGSARNPFQFALLFLANQIERSSLSFLFVAISAFELNESVKRAIIELHTVHVSSSFQRITETPIWWKYKFSSYLWGIWWTISVLFQEKMPISDYNNDSIILRPVFRNSHKYDGRFDVSGPALHASSEPNGCSSLNAMQVPFSDSAQVSFAPATQHN